MANYPSGPLATRTRRRFSISRRRQSPDLGEHPILGTKSRIGWASGRPHSTKNSSPRDTVCEHEGVVVGFVDAEPGEVTRLFILPEAAGVGLGRRLLKIGIAQARMGHSGPIRLEATINAEGFYQKCGFRSVGRGCFSHGLGGEPIEIVRMEFL
ncbi:GNAT family N-acetyltransferase [Bradyrhizobium sp. CCBAU 21360]|uniref:GNAT family N-acetyltransferase n=1 Tax=Bradyrhizobium sp. CCBAU 21360 TaxID=1325081 RepID=UPI002304E4BF|nr:GNAT family N-acetyltransferase [Bradyrhizobium sp. CCBAU 21360]